MLKFSTERLYLREMTQNDFPALSRILRDPEVMYAYEGAFTEAETQAWLDNQFRRYADRHGVVGGLFHNPRHQPGIAESGGTQRHEAHGFMGQALPWSGYAAFPL